MQGSARFASLFCSFPSVCKTLLGGVYVYVYKTSLQSLQKLARLAFSLLQTHAASLQKTGRPLQVGGHLPTNVSTRGWNDGTCRFGPTQSGRGSNLSIVLPSHRIG